MKRVNVSRMAGLPKVKMKTYISNRNLFLVVSFFLSFVLLFSFSSTVVFGNISDNTVNVNAQIQPSQILKIDGKSAGDSRSKVFTPVNLSDAEKNEEDRLVTGGKFNLNLGSNTDWQLFAKVVNLGKTKDLLEDAGWKLERFSISLGRKETELGESQGKIASGSLGERKLEISFEVIIKKIDPSGDEVPLEELENVIVFSLK